MDSNINMVFFFVGVQLQIVLQLAKSISYIIILGIAARKLLNLAIAGRQLRAASFTYYMLQPQTQDSQFDSQWNSSRSKKNLSKL